MRASSRREIEDLLEHTGWLRPLARSLVRDEGATDDLIRDACVSVLRSEAAPTQTFRGWFYGVVRNLGSKRRAREARRNDVELRAAAPEATPSTCDVVTRVELQRVLAAAVLALREPYRSAVVLRYFEGLEPAAIALLQGCNRATARQRVARGLDQLRSKLDAEHGGRERWCAWAVPIAHSSATTLIPTSTTLAAPFQGILMGSKLVFGGAVALAVLVLCVVVLRTTDAPQRIGDARVGSSETSLTAQSHDPRADAAATLPADSLIATRETPVANSVTLRILGPDDRPAAAARVLVLCADDSFEVLVSDAFGWVTVARGKPAERIVVDAEKCCVQSFALATDAVEQTIRLDPGITIAGRVWIDGESPRTAFPLALTDPGVAALLTDLPTAATLALFDAAAASTAHARTTTADDGSFAFFGASDSAPPVISWPGPYFLEDRHKLRGVEPLVVTTPTSAIDLRLVTGSEVRGRIVDHQGSPIADASARIETGESRRIESSTRSDERGRVVFLRAPQQPFPATLHFAWPDGADGRELPIAVPLPGEIVVDLGDLVLDDVSEIALEVVDAGGAPIARASVGYPQERAVRTDERGHARIAVGELDDSLIVKALGYRSQRVPIPDSADSIRVSLQRACALEFHITGTLTGSDSLELTLAADGALFDCGADLGLEPEQSSPGSGMVADERGIIVYSTSRHENGVFRFFGIAPSLPLRATLSQMGSTRKQVEPVAALFAGEQRRVDITLDAELVTQGIRVVDEQQRPIAGAIVTAWTRDLGSSLMTETAVDGRGELALDASQRVDLVVRAKGFATAAEPGILPTASELPIALRTGRRVEVELRNPDGRVVMEDCGIYALLHGGWSPGGVAKAKGRFVFTDLPVGEVVFEVKSSFGFVTRAHDTAIPLATIVIGEPGSVVARFIAEANVESSYAIAVAAPAAERDLTRMNFDAAEPDAQQRVFRGLPCGMYEVWLERRETSPPYAFTRIGSARRVELSPTNPESTVEFKSP